MNAKLKLASLLGGVGLATGTLMAGPLIVVQPPTVVVNAAVPVPAPAVSVSVGVPDDYTWDGYEYVGLVGDQYYYLGPNHVWLTMDPHRLGRFHDWERVHADWRAHAIRNVDYRHDAHGHEVPFHDAHPAPVMHPGPDGHPGPGYDHGHDGDDHHDH